VAYLAEVLSDAPLSIIEAIVLTSVSYYWADMNPDPSHFLYFLGTLIALEAVGQSLSRALCALIRKLVTASALSSVIILTFGTVAGFMPSYESIPNVLRWLPWVTPVSYAFEGLMINEFSRRTLSALP
jgi:ABC-type multidrug transport system permease subunit